jgi:hypothetical protein
MKREKQLVMEYVLTKINEIKLIEASYWPFKYFQEMRIINFQSIQKPLPFLNHERRRFQHRSEFDNRVLFHQSVSP